MNDDSHILLEKKNEALQLLRDGRHLEAKSLFHDVCEMDNNDMGARYMLAVTHVQLGDYRSAETGIRRVIVAMPELADAHFILGQTLQGQNKLDEAADCYRKAASLNPDMIEAYYHLGCVMHLLGDRNEALKSYQQALQIKPDHVDALINQGGIYQELGKLDAAIACYRQALDLRPDLDYLRCALGVALVQQGNQDSGLELLHQGLGIQSSLIDAILTRHPDDQRVITAASSASASQSLPDITIATSLAPKNIENQRAATDSWKQLGFNVVSINSADEIRQLKGNFPDIDFVTASRDASKYCGKPYIYFDDFLSYFKDTEDKICGIINSDIHLRNVHLKSIVSSEAPDSFLFGNRVDITSSTTNEGKVFQDGFDYFFFDRTYLDLYPEDEFCLGLPWWDYWAVLVPMLNQVPVKKLAEPTAFHITHPINWDETNWKLLGNKIAEYIGMHRQPTVQMLGYCARYIVFLIEKHSRKVSLASE